MLVKNMTERQYSFRWYIVTFNMRVFSHLTIDIIG